MSESVRTVELSPYWAAQADILLAKLDDPRSFTIDEIPVILGQARALAVRVTQMWDAAGDKQRADQDDDDEEEGITRCEWRPA